MAYTYDIIDRDGRQITSFGNVLGMVALTDVETNSGSNLVTVASTANLYPGMAVALPNVPHGCFIQAVRSGTVIELYRSTFASGAWTTVAANANASGSATGMTGHAYGYHPLCVIETAFAMGMWRNLHTSNTGLGSVGINTASFTEMTAHDTFGRGVALVPTAGTVTTGVYSATAVDVRTSDALAASPAKRHNGEIWGLRPFVLTGGVQCHVVARPDWSVVCSAIA